MNQEEDKKKEEIEELRKQLTFSFKNLWDPDNAEEMQAIIDFNQDY